MHFILKKTVMYRFQYVTFYTKVGIPSDINTVQGWQENIDTLGLTL